MISQSSHDAVNNELKRLIAGFFRAAGWKISSMAWCDEGPGLKLPEQ